MEGAAADVGKRQHFEQSTAENFVDHGARDHRPERVEHRLRPGPHLVVVIPGKVAEFLTAYRVQGPEHHDLALVAFFENRFEARA